MQKVSQLQWNCWTTAMWMWIPDNVTGSHIWTKFWRASTTLTCPSGSISTVWAAMATPSNQYNTLGNSKYEGAESPRVFWKSAWISFAFLSFFTRYLITARISVFPFSQICTRQQQRVVTTSVLQQEHWCAMCSITNYAWLLHGNLIVTSRGDSENFSNHPRIKRLCGKGKYQSMVNAKKGMKRGNSYWKN